MFRPADKTGIFLPAIRIVEHPKKGYICLATEDIAKGTLIERCPTIKFAENLLRQMWDLNDGRVILHDYNFSRDGTGKGYTFFAMGYGGVYSHSEDPNAQWRIKDSQVNKRETIEIRAIKDITKGEEITIRYVTEPSELWFDMAEEEHETLE